jgi:tetratricopeptide (TPR) repeat protein
MDIPKRAGLLLPALLATLLVSAGPVKPPDDLVRSASEAFARGDLDDAEFLFAQAEEHAADPGLVAFNKGAILYRRNDFRRAELCFRRTLGDAAIPADRRSKALYNLGNCLVRQAGESDIKQLQSAIDCYEMAIREATDDGVRTDASHNLELAKLLWAKARARKPPNERDPEWDDPKDPKEPPPDPKKSPENQPKDGTGEGNNKQDNGAKIEPDKGKDKGVASKEVQKPVPGQGNLPVLPDTDEVPSRSPDDARAFLKKAAERLQRERQKLREEAAQGERPRANDW